MKSRSLAKKYIAYALFGVAVLCAAIACLIYWMNLPEQRVRFAFTQANNELGRPLDTLKVAIEPQTDPTCQKVLKNLSKNGPSTYGLTCRVAQEGFTHIGDDATIKRFRDAAGPLGTALKNHGWQLQLVGYDATTWMNMITYRKMNNLNVSNLNVLLYRKQISPHMFCEFDMLGSDEATGQIAVHVTLLCIQQD